MERKDLYEDDLTEERYPTPGEREDVAQTQALDPDENDPAATDGTIAPKTNYPPNGAPTGRPR